MPTYTYLMDHASHTRSNAAAAPLANTKPQPPEPKCSWCSSPAPRSSWHGEGAALTHCCGGANCWSSQVDHYNPRTAPVAAKVSAPARAELDSIAADSGGFMTRSAAIATAIDDSLIVGSDGLNGIERAAAAGIVDLAARERFIKGRLARRAKVVRCDDR